MTAKLCWKMPGTNYTLYKNLPGSVEVIFQSNPAAIMKGCKNETEMKTLNCHI